MANIGSSEELRFLIEIIADIQAQHHIDLQGNIVV